MDVSLSALRERLLDFRAWDSSGTTLNKRIREALNTALERMAGDVPEALIPDEEHIVLLPDYKGSDTAVAARLRGKSDNRILEFTTEANGLLGTSPTWAPTTPGRAPSRLVPGSAARAESGGPQEPIPHSHTLSLWIGHGCEPPTH